MWETHPMKQKSLVANQSVPEFWSQPFVSPYKSWQKPSREGPRVVNPCKSQFFFIWITPRKSKTRGNLERYKSTGPFTTRNFSKIGYLRSPATGRGVHWAKSRGKVGGRVGWEGSCYGQRASWKREGECAGKMKVFSYKSIRSRIAKAFYDRLIKSIPSEEVL